MAAKIPVIALVGGFLGAGKTTLILHAAGLLERAGLRVAVITNDQDSGLVDTKLARARDLDAREVAGGCFCCRFTDLLNAAEQLRAHDPDVIFAEPVGSCIDIATTVLRPLQALHRDKFRLAPFTVLVDPALAAQVGNGSAPENLAYLFSNQAAEADILCLAKADLYPQPPPFRAAYRLSAQTGEGIREWLDEVLAGGAAGAHPLTVDYTRYAAAETALGWLNFRVEVRLKQPLAPPAVLGPLLDHIDGRLTEAAIEIAHLKAMDETPSGYLKAAITANSSEPSLDGDLLSPPARRHELVINLRALGDPARMREIVEEGLARLPGSVHIAHGSAFRPAAPKPPSEH